MRGIVSFLDRIAACNQGDLSRYRPFVVAGQAVGHIAPEFAEALAGFPDVLRVGQDAVELDPGLTTPAARTEALAGVTATLREQEHFAGWWDEPYPVTTRFGAPELMTIERGAAPPFGTRAYGVHLNGYVRDGDRIRMWVARRSQAKKNAPGKLDQIVAGGQPAGLSLADNLIKECAEEAAIPADLARQARPVGAISYVGERPEGLRNDVLYNFDLEIPADFRPEAADGEVEAFHLWSLEQALETARDTDAFKFNCSLVIIDFLIRHGVLPPDDPDYVDILRGLHG